MLNIEEIEKEINLGNFEYIIEKCDKYINLNIDYPYLYNYRGLCKNNLGLYNEAIKDFNKSIELNKEFENKNNPYTQNRYLADAYYYKGLSKNNLKAYKEAIENFERALKFERSYWLVVYYNIGISKINLGLYEDAIKYFDNIIQMKYCNETKKKEESYYIKLYEYHLSICCSMAFAKLLLEQKVHKNFNNFIEWNEFFIPNNNHIIYIVSLLFENYRYDLIEKIFNCLSEKEYNDLWKNDATFNLLRSKIRDEKVLSNIKKNLLYQYLLLQSLSFNNKTLKSEYAYDIEISHYASLNTLLKLINDKNEENNKSKIRITNISNVNDPKEGRILENIFNKNGLNIKIDNKENLITFQTSFTRNKDALTMFRLYGKNEDKEATGICLVIDKKYFNCNPHLSLIIESNVDDEKQEEKGNENYKIAKEMIFKRLEKRNLYWIIYYNEETNQLIFNPTKSKYSSVVSDLNIVKNNKKNINKIEDLINCIFHNIIKGAKEIYKQIKDKELKEEIFSNLFENIKYVIKHEAFFEEQELRMLITTNYKNENIKEDNKRLYINYNELFNENENFIKEIILGNKIENKELMSDYIKQIIYNKYKDNHKMNEIKVSVSKAPLR